MSSAGRNPGNRTVADDSSSSDEVFECALEVDAKQAAEMATTAKQKRRATAALLKEVRNNFRFNLMTLSASAYHYILTTRALQIGQPLFPFCITRLLLLFTQ